MLLQVDVYLHTSNKKSGDQLPPADQTLFVCLNVATSSKILTVGRKDADVILPGDKSVSRQHMNIELVASKKYEEIEGKPSPRSAETTQEIDACKTCTSGIVAVLSDSSRFGTYLVAEDTLKSTGDESETGDDETDDEGQAVSQQLSSQLSNISSRIFSESKARSIKVEKSICLPALSNSSGRVVIQCGQNGSTLVISRVPLCMAVSRASAAIKKQWNSRAHLLGITFLENLEMNLTHLVTDERITNAKSLVAWCLRKPMVTFEYLDALWTRRSATDPLPDSASFPPVAGDEEVFWDNQPNRKLWSHLTMLSCIAGDDMEAVCRASGAKTVRLYDVDDPFATADRAHHQDGTSCFFINSTSKKHSKIISYLKTKLKLPYVSQKLVAQCVSLQEPLKDSLDQVIGTPSVKRVKEKTPAPVVANEPDESKSDKFECKDSPDHPPESTRDTASTKHDSHGSKRRTLEEEKSSQQSKRSCTLGASQNEDTQWSSKPESQQNQNASEATKRARDEGSTQGNAEETDGFEEHKPKRKKKSSLGGWTDVRQQSKADALDAEAVDTEDNDIAVATNTFEEDEVDYIQRKGLPKTEDGWLIAAPRGKARNAFKATEAELLDSLGEDTIEIPPTAETVVIDTLLVAPKSQRRSVSTTSGVDFKRFRKNTVIPRGVSRIQMRLVLPKQSDRQIELQEEQSRLEASLREADALFQDRSNSIRSHFKPRGKRGRNV